MNVVRGLALCLFAASVLAAPSVRASDALPSLRRVAVLVGANAAPPGRQPLRFAHADAQQLADVLVRVGHFSAADIRVLLDPTPAEVAGALAAAQQQVVAAHGDAMFVFYYSGHSDGQLLYPHGEPLSVSDLRERIEHIGARIRIGVLDTCRGGSWTQAKGLSVGPPLDPTALLNVSTEGTALISSSSGLESAHEADAVNGSFFTHHFAAGLLGAADRTGDGNITLEEAFDYAKERTVRDSARLAQTPQHPSFDLQLRGRQDIVLTSIAASPSALEVTQSSAPIEIIHLPSGVTVAEAPPASAPVRIAVAPGHYLVRSVIGDRVRSREIDIHPGETVSIAGGQLEATGDSRLAVKGEEGVRARPIVDASTPPGGWGVAQLQIGFFDSGSSLAPGLYQGWGWGSVFSYGLTDRLALGVPFSTIGSGVGTGLLLHYRLGEAGRFEVIPFGGPGFIDVGWGRSESFAVGFEAGADVRAWTARNASVILGLSGGYTRTDAGHGVGGSLSIGGAWTIGDVVTLHFAVDGGVSQFSVRPGSTLAAVTPPTYTTLSFALGSVQALGSLSLPLVQVHVTPRFSLDAHASWAVGFGATSTSVVERYLGGFTWAF